MKGKKIMLSKEGNYGNWVPANMMKLMWAGDIVLAVLTIVFAAVLKVAVPAWITGVLLVILQIPGSSGTYPIEMTPVFFQRLHPLLPFSYGIGAMRECIAGFYGNYYMVEMAKMALYLIPSLLLGLLLRKPIVRLNEVFIEKLESTKLM